MNQPIWAPPAFRSINSCQPLLFLKKEQEMKGFRITLPLLALAIMALPGVAKAQLSGAIWTTTKDGQTVNGNIYQKKCDVYLNGGPQNTSGGKALPDGLYFFQ